MKAQLVSIEEDEGGLAVVSFAGVEISAMDCLGYGESEQSYPMVDQLFEPRFTCLFDDDDPVDWNSLFNGNPFEEQRLKSTGIWSYRAFGKLVAGDSPEQNLLADCGGPLIPLPIDVYGDEEIGAYVAFNIMRLSAWSA
jgi:hypothetical protein